MELHRLLPTYEKMLKKVQIDTKGSWGSPYIDKASGLKKNRHQKLLKIFLIWSKVHIFQSSLTLDFDIRGSISP